MEKGQHGCGCRNHKNQRLLEVSLLLALARGTGYGYALLEDLAELGFSDQDLNIGTLYRRLRKMEEDGLVESNWEAGLSGPSRRVYGITETGRKELLVWMEILKERKTHIEALIEGYGKLEGSQGVPAGEKETK